MKKLILSAGMLMIISLTKAQDFNASLTDAKANYTSGKLAESRYAMQQILKQIDKKAGEEVLKLYPETEAGFNTMDKGTVNGSSSGLGVSILRSYAKSTKTIEVNTMTNSPLIQTLNALIAASTYMGNPDQKMIKIAGYKAMLQKNNADSGANYQLQIPLNNTLITLNGDQGVTEEEILAFASKLPLDAIKNLLQ